MRRRHQAVLALITIVFGLGALRRRPELAGIPSPGRHTRLFRFAVPQGLDLQGGLHVRFEADPAPGQAVDADAMEAVRQIIENRVNALGVAEPVIQIEGDNRLIVELPGLGGADADCEPTDEACEDPLDAAINLFRETGQLLIVDTGSRRYPEGEVFVADPEDVVLRGADLQTARVEFDQLGATSSHSS